MGSLQTYQVENWGEFITENEIDLLCPSCKGRGSADYGCGPDTEECEKCNGSGYMEILWNTIWNTGFHATPKHPTPAEAHGVAVFEWDDHIWFGLQACGMDMTPHLAACWLEMFPDCQWLPDQFIVTGVNLRGGYVETCVGKKVARRIYALMGKTIKGMRQQAAYLAEDLKAARQHLNRKPNS